VHARVMREVIGPAVRGMAAEGEPFTGFLYAGLMIDGRGRVKTAQPILMRLRSDLLEVLLAATEGRLDEVQLEWDRRVALGVVLAASGYPQAPRKGDPIAGLPDPAEDAVVFHAATALREDRLVTAGGRVLCVTALADSVRRARERAYELAHGIHFDGVQYRRDIGHRALK